MKDEFINKTVLITGASQGLGLEIAKLFWHKGANLILISRNEKKLQEVSEQLNIIKSNNQHIHVFSVDLANAESLTHFIDLILPNFKIDILINNAARQTPIGCFWENNWQEWLVTLQLNLHSPIRLCHALVPSMIKNGGGKIINLSGGGATKSRPRFSAYAVSKVGLVRFSEILAEELKSFNITVNAIAPGIMNTQLLQEIFSAGIAKAGKTEFQQAQAVFDTENLPLERAAALCAFLASDRSLAISGKLISAVWDPWERLPEFINELESTDIYTLRRITPKDRAKDWDEPK